MDVIATLLLGHLIADFPLQVKWVFRLKTRHWVGILFHAVIHTVVTAILLQQPLSHWPILISLCLIHFATDWFKLRIDFKFQSIGFILDQIAHLLVLLWLANWPSKMTAVLTPIILYPAVVYALVPALLMFLSVLIIDLEKFAFNLASWWQNKALQLISLSQIIGYPLVVGVLIVRFSG